MSYDPNPEDIISSVIGYTVLTENGPLLDSQNNVPLTLTSDQAAIVSLAIRTKTNEAYTVTPFPFHRPLYAGRPGNLPDSRCGRLTFACRNFCKHHAFEKYKAVLPNVPGRRAGVQIDPEWIIPSARRQEFNETVGRPGSRKGPEVDATNASDRTICRLRTGLAFAAAKSTTRHQPGAAGRQLISAGAAPSQSFPPLHDNSGLNGVEATSSPYEAGIALPASR